MRSTLTPKLLLAVMGALVLVYMGCSDDFLVRQPPSSLSEDTFYRTEGDAISAVNAAYASLQLSPLYSEEYPKVAEVPSDDIMLANTSGLSFDNFSFTPSERQLEEVFAQSYQGVFRSNLVIQRVPEIEMAEDKKQRIIGEAQFLRALYYWHLATLFGDVPIVKKATPNDPSAAVLAKSPINEVYSFMIEDLQKAVDVLPRSYGGANVGRATWGAALSLLGKVYLYAGKYTEAEKAFQQVIDSGEYTLVSNYADVFSADNENNSESVFEVQYHDVGGNAWSNQDGPGSNESTLRDRLSLPNGQGGFGNLLPTQDLVDAFEEGDLRLAYSVWMEGDVYDPSSGEMYDPGWSVTGYSLRKGMVPIKLNDSTVETNWPIIRYADVLLMYAEAANENGNLMAALEAVNQVRARAEMPPLPTEKYPADSKEAMFEAIVHERRVELAFEYHRFHDLRRWGLAEQELGPLGYASRNRYHPLPQAEVDANTALEQNPNY